MLFVYNEVYFDIIDFEFNENENYFFVSFKNTSLKHNVKVNKRLIY